MSGCKRRAVVRVRWAGLHAKAMAQLGTGTGSPVRARSVSIASHLSASLHTRVMAAPGDNDHKKHMALPAWGLHFPLGTARERGWQLWQKAVVRPPMTIFFKGVRHLGQGDLALP